MYQYLNNELKEPEEVKEEAGLVGYQEVEQDTRVAAHDADELDETSRRGGVKQALGIQRGREESADKEVRRTCR